MRNIIITGGELFNKGAQAMTFISVDELHRRFPEHEIILLSEMDKARPKAEQEIYNFRFIGWYPIKFAHSQHDPLLWGICNLKNKREYRKAVEIYSMCDAMIDISGYALSSRWSYKVCDRYLNHLEFAKAFHIPVYLMPQSFGPFDFGAENKKLDKRIRRLLPTAKVIFAREQEGYEALTKTYGLTNVQLAQDLVLSSGNIDLTRVFKKLPNITIPDVLPKSVALIPNTMNAEMGSSEYVQKLYADIIKAVLSHGRNVYIIRHSEMDAALCSSLKKMFSSDENVILSDRDFNCLEFNELVKKFDYCVASRYHAIVHAYKNGIPCVVVGWATKYHDLLKRFKQEKYMFDVREQICSDELTEAISRMETNYRDESISVLSELSKIQEQNVFDILGKSEK